MHFPWLRDVQGTLVVVAVHDGFQVVDVADPTAPRVLPMQGGNSTSLLSVGFAGETLYVGTEYDGVWAYHTLRRLRPR